MFNYTLLHIYYEAFGIAVKSLFLTQLVSLAKSIATRSDENKQNRSQVNTKLYFVHR